MRVTGQRALLAGHLPLAEDGSIAKPLGKVGAEVSAAQGYEAHTRSAVGMAELPLGVPVEIEGEIALRN